MSSNSSGLPLVWNAPIGHFHARHVYALLFMVSIGFFCLRTVTGQPPGMIHDLMVVASCATCGWSWLLTRALFRSNAEASIWPLSAVLVLSAGGAYLQFAAQISGIVSGMVGNVLTLLSSVMLLLAVAEPVRGLKAGMPRAEHRFRYLFAGGYAILVAVTVIWIGAPSAPFAAKWGDTIKVVAALLAIVAMGLALWYRGRTPLPQSPHSKRRNATDGDRYLAERIIQTLRTEALYTVPNLKVADLARRLGEAEYKVTQSLTVALGFRNFNHMINSLRIEQARRMLSDPNMAHLPVLTLALDCGFASIGPFNRAFKAETGVTPTQFRTADVQAH